jgi:predicted O-methyltransferase YrrM
LRNQKESALCREKLGFFVAENHLLRHEKLGENMLGSTIDHAKNHYGPVLLNPSTLAAICSRAETWQEIFTFHHLLATDEYTQYVDSYYREAHRRFGKEWRYFDITSVLFGSSKTLQPKNYLEIGVRRGRSVCTVARACPSVNIVAFDMWMENYAGMENPGPDFVQAELRKHGHSGSISFCNGDSHKTIPEFFRRYPEQKFDLITVDGDHSETGAMEDLENVVPHLSVGGVIVFDDVSHPTLPHLHQVWRTFSERHPNLAAFEFRESGFGVAFAIRKG